MAKVVLSFSDGSFIDEFPLIKRRVTVGRSKQNDIHIANSTVSGQHAQIVQIDGKYYVEDLLSTNGTFVNGDKIVRHELEFGDVVRIGQHELKFADDLQGPVAASGEATITVRAEGLDAGDVHSPLAGPGEAPRGNSGLIILVAVVAFALSGVLAYVLFSNL